MYDENNQRVVRIIFQQDNTHIDSNPFTQGSGGLYEVYIF